MGGRGAAQRGPGKTVRGRPGHRGVSYHVKTYRTVVYAAETCGGCGGPDLELMDPINKPAADFGEGEGEDAKDAYTARIIFGWCGPCRNVTDPAPHLVWGTWVSGRALAAIIRYKGNPQGRSSIMENLCDVHGFAISSGAVSNAITAYAKNLEGRVLPDSVAAFVKAKMDAGDDPTGRDAHPAREPAAREPLPPSPAHPAITAGPPRRKTRKELEAEGRKVPHHATPQGATGARPTRSTTSYPGSHSVSFVERCRERLTVSPYMGPS